MSFPTQPVFVYNGNWSATTRSHPAMKFMEDYTHIVDKKHWDTTSEYHSPDFTFQKPDGTIYKGDSVARPVFEELYAPFAEHLHEPKFLCCFETADGWQMIGVAHLYVNLVGPPGEEPKVDSEDGRKWDVSTPSAFWFEYAKGGKHGVVLKNTKIYGDSGPALVGLLKKGVLKPEDLLK